MWFPRWCSGKKSTYKCNRHRLGPWIRRSPRVGTGNPLQYSCLENSTDKGAWQAVVQGSQKARHNRVHTHTVQLCICQSPQKVSWCPKQQVIISQSDFQDFNCSFLTILFLHNCSLCDLHCCLPLASFTPLLPRGLARQVTTALSHVISLSLCSHSFLCSEHLSSCSGATPSALAFLVHSTSPLGSSFCFLGEAVISPFSCVSSFL